MNKIEALAKATEKAERTGRRHLVIHRPDHPHVTGDWYYVIAEDAKHSWLPSETIVAVAV